MGRDEDEIPCSRGWTLSVLSLLTLAAAVFSYLGAYNIPGALARNGVIEQWPQGRDPRPQWMATTFATLLVSFLLLAAVFRFTSTRQLRRLDATADD